MRFLERSIETLFGMNPEANNFFFKLELILKNLGIVQFLTNGVFINSKDVKLFFLERIKEISLQEF